MRARRGVEEDNWMFWRFEMFQVREFEGSPFCRTLPELLAKKISKLARGLWLMSEFIYYDNCKQLFIIGTREHEESKPGIIIRSYA